MNRLKILKGFMIFLALMVSIGGMFTAASAATLSTDKPDYAPGEVVIITGSGWLPGETVSMILHEESQLSEPDVTLLSDADADGNIINAIWSPDSNDIGLTFTLTATGLSSNLTAQTMFTDSNSCGNGNLQPNSPQNEQCDDGNQVSSDGCSSTCQIETGWICVGDHPSVCTPDCGDGLVVGTEQCDEGEAINGTAGSCCTSICTFKSAGTECRASEGECDIAETCTGSSGQCPADVKSTAVCRPKAGDCDVAERCDGAGNDCPADGFVAAGDVCRPSAGVCDPAEECTGTGPACPTDAKSTAVCRPKAGDCDVAESCNGAGNDCPADSFKPSSEVCRASLDICDATENCTGTGPDCPDDLAAECSLVTSSELCTFDIDNVLTDDQFRVIFTPDLSTPTSKLSASNPGQFYYNILYLGDGNTDLHIALPYPFVTQGAVPIHIYDDVTITTDDSTMCFDPGNEIANSKTVVTMVNYGPNTFGTTTDVVVHIPAVSGQAYINMHLDYGLKGTPGYAKSTKTNNNDAVSAANTTVVLIPDKQAYNFSITPVGIPGDTVQSDNVFKKNPGIGGIVFENDGSTPAGANIRVNICDSKNVCTIVKTDNDGWYMWAFKYTGKAATFTLTLPDYTSVPAKTVTLKSNGYSSPDPAFRLP